MCDCVCVADDEYDSEDEEDEAERQRAQQAREHLASVAKLQITAADPASAGKEGKAERVLKMEMPAESTLGELFRALQDDEVCTMDTGLYRLNNIRYDDIERQSESVR